MTKSKRPQKREFDFGSAPSSLSPSGTLTHAPPALARQQALARGWPIANLTRVINPATLRWIRYREGRNQKSRVSSTRGLARAVQSQSSESSSFSRSFCPCIHRKRLVYLVLLSHSASFQNPTPSSSLSQLVLAAIHAPSLRFTPIGLPGVTLSSYRH